MIRWSQSLCLLLSGTVLGTAFGESPVPEPGDKEALGKAAIVGFSANAQAFPFSRCRYRCTKGQAKSVEDAIRGKIFNARFYDSRLIIKGEKVLFEGFAPLADPKQTRPVPGRPGNFTAISPGSSDRYLNDGARELDYVPTLQSINLFSADKRARGIPGATPFPWGPKGNGDANNYLEQPARYDFSVPGAEEIDGRPVVTVRFDEKKVMRVRNETRAFAYTFSFDPSRGYLPIRREQLWNGKPKIRVFITHARECSNSRWLPERSIIVDTPDKADGLYDVREIKLLEMDVDEQPRDDEFVITVPAGTGVLEDGNERGLHFALKKDERIRMEDVPTLFAMLEKSKDNPLMDTAIPRSEPYAWLRWAGIVAGLALASGGALFLVRRRRRAQFRAS